MRWDRQHQTYPSAAGAIPVIFATEQPHQGKPTRFCSNCGNRRIAFKHEGVIRCAICSKRAGVPAVKSGWFLQEGSRPTRAAANAHRERIALKTANLRARYNETSAITPAYAY